MSISLKMVVFGLPTQFEIESIKAEKFTDKIVSLPILRRYHGAFGLDSVPTRSYGPLLNLFHLVGAASPTLHT